MLGRNLVRRGVRMSKYELEREDEQRSSGDVDGVVGSRELLHEFDT